MSTPRLYSGGIESAAGLHPAYQQHLAGNSSQLTRPTNEFVRKNNSSVDPSPIFDPAQLITQDQRRFFRQNYETTRNPTRFDVQNTALPLGGQPLPVHRDALGESRVRPAIATPTTIPATPLGPASSVYANPGPFDFDAAVTSAHPPPLTIPQSAIERMLRNPDEVDPALVTNPIPDPTFMSRHPTFDKAPEYAAEQRRRMQRNGAMRFW